MLKKTIKGILFILGCSVFAIAAEDVSPKTLPPVTKEVVDQLTKEWKESSVLVSKRLRILNSGLIALNNPSKVVKDFSIYETAGDLPKEDKLVIEDLLFLAKANPEFSLSSITSNEGYLAYKKILSDYTYQVEEALTISANLESSVQAGLKSMSSSPMSSK